jgi:hypothetical protein
MWPILGGNVKRKIYLIQPTYRANDGRLFQGKRMLVHSCAIPALAASIPADWHREICIEFFEDVNYDTDAAVVGLSSMGYDILHGYEIADEFRRRGKRVIIGGYQAHFNRGRLREVADSIVYGNPGPMQMARILGDVEACSLAPEYDMGINVDFPVGFLSCRPLQAQVAPINAHSAARLQSSKADTTPGRSIQ